MIAVDTDFYFPAIRELLRNAYGQARALTLDQLTEAVCAPCRRITEQTIEAHLSEFGFALVAGCHGYWRPMKADELNQYVSSLHSRHRRMQLREQTIIRLALQEGFTLDGELFVDAPTRQIEMPLLDPRARFPADVSNSESEKHNKGTRP
jgi:hypothetical protein